MRARVYEMMADYERAILDWSRIIELNPTYAMAYVRRGHARGMKGEANQAFADFDLAISLKPERKALAQAFLGREMFTPCETTMIVPLLITIRR